MAACGGLLGLVYTATPATFRISENWRSWHEEVRQNLRAKVSSVEVFSWLAECPDNDVSTPFYFFSRFTRTLVRMSPGGYCATWSCLVFQRTYWWSGRLLPHPAPSLGSVSRQSAKPFLETHSPKYNAGVLFRS